MKYKLFVTILFTLCVIPAAFVSAGVEDRFKGWAWSSNIGWISFNCDNTDYCDTVDYGVTVEANNTTISGYAWSSNIGWINMSGATYNGATGLISGTVSAIAGSTEADGWNGDIVLYDNAPVAYQVDVEIDTEAAGWAWGSTVVGWISFNCENTSTCGTVDYQVTVEPFFFNFTADTGLSLADQIPYAGTATLSWTTIGADSCTGSGSSIPGWPGGKTSGFPTDFETITPLIQNEVFTLVCQDSFGRTITRDLDIFVDPPAPSLTLYADDYNIGFNTSTTIRWDALYIGSCTKSGVWGTGAGSIGAGQSESTGNLTNLENYFNLTCVSDNPLIYPSPVFAQVLVNVEKLTLDFELDSDNAPFSDPTVLDWTSTFATSCTASGGASTTWAVVPAKGITTDQVYTQTVYKGGTTEHVEPGNYLFTLNCLGAGGQQIIKSQNLKIGKNPNFSENIGDNPDYQQQ